MNSDYFQDTKTIQSTEKENAEHETMTHAPQNPARNRKYPARKGRGFKVSPRKLRAATSQGAPRWLNNHEVACNVTQKAS